MKDKYYIVPIFVPHRGCPHNCIFCNQKKITGEIQNISYSDVIDTIDKYVNTMDRKNSFVEVSFFGGSFTGIPIDYQNELLEAANKALSEGKVDTIRLSTRPDYISKKILDNLKRYNVGVIELGVQSMDTEVLRIAERGHTANDVINASNLIKEYGFKLGLQMMVGLPFDNNKKDIYTADEIIKLKPDFVRIYPALVIKDTYMEKMYMEGLYNPLSVDETINICSELYKKFTKHNIKIIRIGLQPTDKINMGKDVVAGPFHPAIRELVESSILNDMMEYCINKYFNNSSKITITISPRDISRLFADKKRFFNSKIDKFTPKRLIIRQDTTAKNFNLCFDDGENKKSMSIFEFINISL